MLFLCVVGRTFLIVNHSSLLKLAQMYEFTAESVQEKKKWEKSIENATNAILGSGAGTQWFTCIHVHIIIYMYLFIDFCTIRLRLNQSTSSLHLLYMYMYPSSYFNFFRCGNISIDQLWLHPFFCFESVALSFSILGSDLLSPEPHSPGIEDSFPRPVAFTPLMSNISLRGILNE